MDNFILDFHAQIADSDRIPVVLLALLVTLIIGMISGPLAGNANPFFWSFLDFIFGKMGDKLNRAHRVRNDLVLRGFILSSIVIILSAALGKALIIGVAREPLYGVSDILLLSLFMTSGAVWFLILRLYVAMEQKQVGKGAYYAVARSTRINLAAGDDYGVTRAALVFSARSFDKGLVAPALWFFIAGFPGVCVYAALAALAWRFGQNGFTKGFGAVPLALERLLGFIPSMLAAFYLTLGTLFTPTTGVVKGLTAWFGHKNRAPYEQGGFPVSALAWALNVSLGGSVQDLAGTALKGVWVGPEGATAQIDHKHLRRGLYIHIIAHLLFAASWLGAYMWAAAFGGA